MQSDILYPKRRADVRSTLLPDGHLVVFNPDSDWAHTLNPTAAIAWELSDGSHNIEQMVQKIAELMPQSVDTTQLTADLTALFQELQQAGLLGEVSGDPVCN